MPVLPDKGRKVIEIFSSSDKGPEIPVENWIKKQIENLQNSSSTKQLAVSGVTGIATGYVSGKLGRVFAYGIGGTIILVHFAHRAGYIKFNWNEFNNDIQKAKKNVSKNVEKVLPTYFQATKNFAKNNFAIVSGFIGGFFIGIASS